MATTYVCPNSVLVGHVLRTNGLNAATLPVLPVPNPHNDPGIYYVRSLADVAQSCMHCRRTVVPVNNLIAYRHAGANQRAYDVSWYGTENGIRYLLSMTTGLNHVNNFILPIDPVTTPAIAANTLVPSVDAGWVHTNLAHANYHAHRLNNPNGAVPSINGTAFELGFQNSNNTAGFGLVHTLYRHPRLAVDGIGNAPANNSTQDLSGLNTNLRRATEGFGAGTGIREIAVADQGRIGIRGVYSGDSIRIVITAHPHRILTAYNGAHVIQGFLHNPVTRRRWQ
jgi:hypothetical protein